MQLSSIVLVLFLASPLSAQLYLWVDGEMGDDNNPGTEDAPFKTLTKARDTIRHMKKFTPPSLSSVVVHVRPSDYPFTDEPFHLTAEDSGDPRSNIDYVAYYAFVDSGDAHLAAGAHLTAGVPLKWEAVSPVTDPRIRSQLHESAKDKIVQVDLKKLGIMDYGDLQSGGNGCDNNKLELFAEDMNMVLARYPNIDENGRWQWLDSGEVLDSTSFSFNTNTTVADRILSWKNTSSLWLHGYWNVDCADNYVRVESIDRSKSAFVIDPETPPVYGFKTNARYYALNILEELDMENEYYVDRGAGILYLLESTAKKLSSPDYYGCLSSGQNVVLMENVSNIFIIGFQMDCSRSTGLVIKNGFNITLVGSVVSFTGETGIEVTGTDNFLGGLFVTKTGCGGVYLTGGDQKSLTNGSNTLESSQISFWANWKRTYQPGIKWGGVRNAYISNELQNAPHVGILGDGNDCLFEGNTLDTLCYETSDSGAFYTGQNWIDRGNVLRRNTFKNIYNTEKPHLVAPSVQAIYLDDQMSGWSIVNNTFVNCHVGVFIGGGRRNDVMLNRFLNCSTSVHIDNRGMKEGKQHDFCSPGGLFEQQLKSRWTTSSPLGPHTTLSWSTYSRTIPVPPSTTRSPATPTAIAADSLTSPLTRPWIGWTQ